MHLHFYLKPPGRDRIARGERTMPARVIEAVRQAGWTVTLHPEAEIPQIPHRDGFHMVANTPVDSPNCLTLRPAGFEPFWSIEATNDRWDWPVAAKSYAPPDVPDDRIAAFLATWRAHLKLPEPGQGGGIFVPLQGKLTQRRSFQAASPVAMLQQVLARWPGRPVTASLHPRESYAPEDHQALADLQAGHPNFRLMSGSEGLLAACDLVVTENSTLALKGFLLAKPAMLWARIDWHHIAASVPRDGPERAFAEAETPRDFGRYLFWYCRRQNLFAWEDNPKAIRKRLRDHGWPVAEPK